MAQAPAPPVQLRLSSEPGVVGGTKGPMIVGVDPAVEQRSDALRVDLQQGHLLPEPLTAGGIGTTELGVGELPHQMER